VGRIGPGGTGSPRTPLAPAPDVVRPGRNPLLVVDAEKSLSSSGPGAALRRWLRPVRCLAGKGPRRALLLLQSSVPAC